MRLTWHLYFKDNDVDLHLVYTFDQNKKKTHKKTLNSVWFGSLFNVAINGKTLGLRQTGNLKLKIIHKSKIKSKCTNKGWWTYIFEHENNFIL